MIARRVKWREKRICILFVKIVKREKWLEKWENHEVISALLNGLIIYNNWILCYTYWSLQQTYNIFIEIICFQMRVISSYTRNTDNLLFAKMIRKFVYFLFTYLRCKHWQYSSRWRISCIILSSHDIFKIKETSL